MVVQMPTIKTIYGLHCWRRVLLDTDPTLSCLVLVFRAVSGIPFGQFGTRAYLWEYGGCQSESKQSLWKEPRGNRGVLRKCVSLNLVKSHGPNVPEQLPHSHVEAKMYKSHVNPSSAMPVYARRAPVHTLGCGRV